MPSRISDDLRRVVEHQHLLIPHRRRRTRRTRVRPGAAAHSVASANPRTRASSSRSPSGGSTDPRRRAKLHPGHHSHRSSDNRSPVAFSSRRRPRVRQVPALGRPVRARRHVELQDPVEGHDGRELDGAARRADARFVAVCGAAMPTCNLAGPPPPQVGRPSHPAPRHFARDRSGPRMADRVARLEIVLRIRPRALLEPAARLHEFATADDRARLPKHEVVRDVLAVARVQPRQHEVRAVATLRLRQPEEPGGARRLRASWKSLQRRASAPGTDRNTPPATRTR